MESDISTEEEPEKCGICEDGDDLMTHLEESFSCMKSHARELLPRRWWEERYMNDTSLLLLDLSLRLQLCLNTGSCPLPRNRKVSQWPRHLEESLLCFQFYRSHPGVVEHLTDGIAQNVMQLAAKLSPRTSNLKRTRIDEDRTGITGFEARIAREMCNKCSRCGLLRPFGERFKLTKKSDERGTLTCKDCQDAQQAIHVQPANLTERRRAVFKANTGESDHLVALRAEHHTGHILFPANVVNHPSQACVTEGRRDEEFFTVVVPTTVSAIKRLNEAARRASDEWMTGLKSVTLATEAPRTISLEDFPMLLQAASALHRAKLATFRRSVIHRAEALSNAASAEIHKRSPKKIRASYETVKFEHCMAGAMKDTLPWSDGAVSERMCQSEARRAWNGKVKNSVKVRILSDESVNWSQSLKVMVAKTFERDVTTTVEGVQTLMCAGGCTPATCNNEHPQLDEFLEENMVGLARLARIPVVLTYLKVAVACFEKAILRPDCRQWDFNLKFDKEGWNVFLIGSMWTKKRGSLNEKIAQMTRIKTDFDIVRRILLRPEEMETVSLDQGHLQSRWGFHRIYSWLG